MGNDAGIRRSGQRADGFALAAGFLAPLAWGLTGVFIRLLHGLSTLSIVAGRLAVAVLVLAPWGVLHPRQTAAAFRTPLTLTMGGYYLLATEAFARVPVVEVTLLIGGAPIMAVGLERLLGVRPTGRQVAGAAIAILGLALFLGPGIQFESERLFGYLFAVGAAAGSAAYAVGLRRQARAGRPVNPLALTLASCAFGVLASVLLLGGSAPAAVATAVADPKRVLLMASLGVVSTALPTLAFGIASLRLPSILTTSFGLTTPFFAALFAGWFLGEWPEAASIPGAVLALAGIVIVLRSPPGRTSSVSTSATADR